MESSNLNELLIVSVQKRQALYDTTEDNYSNRVFLNRQWKEIGEELGIDDNAARKKWTTLRYYFHKSHKQLTMMKSGSGGEKKKKWYLYDTMTFLLPHIADRKTCCNISEDSENEDDSFLQISETSVQSSERSFPLLPQPVSSACEVAEPPTQASTSTVEFLHPHAPGRGKQNTHRTLTASLDGAILGAIKSIKPTEEKKDEIDLFLQSLASNMRMLDPLSRVECQAGMLFAAKNSF